MRQPSWALLAGLLLALPGTAPAAGSDLAGNWKLTMLDQGSQPTLWLIRLAEKDGTWTGSVLSTGSLGGQRLPEATLEGLNVGKDLVHFNVKMAGRTFSFEGKLPPDKAGEVRGSMSGVARQLMPAVLEPTKVTNLADTYDVNKEIVAQGAGGLKFFQAAVELLGEASAKKAKPEEVRGWAEKAYKAADAYGPRWQGNIATQIAHALTEQDGYTEIALNYARRAERLLDPKAPASERVRVLNVLAAALNKAGKAKELGEVLAKIEKVDTGVTPDKYAGRKGKSDRVVLVELFTGTQCPPCVAADMAFDALAKTYKPAEAALLEYHLHIPGPDPLTNAATEARAQYYEREIQGTPTLILSGHALDLGGGSADAAHSLYEEYRKELDPLLEKPAGAKVTATAVRKGNKVEIAAEAGGVEKAGNDLRLRVVLVEEQVNYQGGNGVRHHHHVVRAMPGGPKGIAVSDKGAKQTATVDLDELRQTLTKYLDEFAKANGAAFPTRPLELKNLKVIAFVQNDKSKEVLQAVQVDVKAAE
ncbi:MAG TPA: hypothetical protein VJ739_01820 [Gemmataceae bacterium]|nr:hypothetical protein [Gemmataceae bacterium]